MYAYIFLRVPKVFSLFTFSEHKMQVENNSESEYFFWSCSQFQKKKIINIS